MTKALKFDPDIDLMATRINTQLPRFLSYRPDPQAYAVDAFSWSWEEFRFYCFPPFACIPRIIQKVFNERVSGIFITPDWKNQLWYSQLRDITVHEMNLPHRLDQLILPSDTTKRHPMADRMHLKASLICTQQR